MTNGKSMLIDRVAGDLAAMEQTARDCVSQGATDRELTDKLVL